MASKANGAAKPKRPMSGVEIDKNPFADDSEAHARWRLGWAKAGDAVDKQMADAEEEGAAARRNGSSRDACPFPEGQPLRDRWLAGWQRVDDEFAQGQKKARDRRGAAPTVQDAGRA